MGDIGVAIFGKYIQSVPWRSKPGYLDPVFEFKSCSVHFAQEGKIYVYILEIPFSSLKKIKLWSLES
jgi:hypothetical protein